MNLSQPFRSAGAWLLCLLVVFSPLSWAQDDRKPATKPDNVLAVKLSGFSDSGRFNLYVAEEILVRINFTWKADGSFENKSVLDFGGQRLAMETAIATDKEGRWTKIDGVSRRGKFSVVREGDKVKRTIGKETKTFDLKPGTLVFENFAPALMTLLVRAYDPVKGGKQTVPLVVIPEALVDVTVERKDTLERSVAGKDLKLTRYDLGLVSVHITVWADAVGKVYLGEVPSQQAAYVREGYEALRKGEVKDPLLSQPTFKVKQEANVRVAMRDGVKLATDIFHPEAPVASEAKTSGAKAAAGESKHPVILVRTPYKKEFNRLTGMYYGRRGYVVAIQDCRGRFSSEGVWEPFVNEAKDGYDTIEWLATQPWCNGKVGMVGGSYVGWVQWWAAGEKPPHLVTIIPNVSPPDPFYNIPYEYGAFFLWGAIWWADVLETGATADLSGEKLRTVTQKKYHKLLKKLPVIELDKVVLGKENPYWRKWIEHPTDDSYWQRGNFHQRLDGVNIPVFHQSGWFDGDGIGSKLNYLRMASLGHANQKLTLGPWGHTDVATRTYGTRDFGPQALRDLPRDYLRWFDYWLKGVDNGVLKEPLVSLFVMNANRWLHGPKYPLPETRFEKWYLTSAGKANTSQGDGRLTRQPPPNDSPPDRYSYDPGDPTPDPDVLEEEEEKAAAKNDDDKAEDTNKDAAKQDAAKKEAAKTDVARTDGEKKAPEKNRREELTKSRRDILVYVTEPFAGPYTFAGPVSAVLYAASSAKDTDWFMRLMTVDPKGKVFPLVAGKIRARFRQSMSTPSFLEPGKVYEYSLDLWQTGITVPKGHRLRVEVASAAFPVFSRNLNSGGHNEKDTTFVTAEQTVHHGARYPSHVVLPMIPEQAQGKHDGKKSLP
jgi:putative CocE/NonD family hydrolase